MARKMKKVRPDGGIWLGPKIVKLAELAPGTKVSVDAEKGSLVIKPVEVAPPAADSGAGTGK